MKLLFVNACVNRATSRTLKLARGVIEAMQAKSPLRLQRSSSKKKNSPHSLPNR